MGFKSGDTPAGGKGEARVGAREAMNLSGPRFGDEVFEDDPSGRGGDCRERLKPCRGEAAREGLDHRSDGGKYDAILRGGGVSRPMAQFN